jgi:hypothetical protein
MHESSLTVCAMLQVGRTIRTMPTRIDTAFDRLDDFVAVQLSERGRVTVEAVTLFQESVGIDSSQRALLGERLERLGPAYRESGGAILLGLALGLLAADLAVSEDAGCV